MGNEYTRRLKLKGRAAGESHVRLYRHELQSPAWRTLSPNGRALLVELRSLYPYSDGNVVFLSVRQAMARLNIGQRPAQAAFAELRERGWITVHEPGGFSRKNPHATSYRLENEPPSESPGALPTKRFMRWQQNEEMAAT